MQINQCFMVDKALHMLSPKNTAYSSLLAMKRPPCDGYTYWQKFCGKLGWCQLHNIMKANSSNWLLFSWQRSVTDLREKCARELRGHWWKPREGLMLARETREKDLGRPAGLYHFRALLIATNTMEVEISLSHFKIFFVTNLGMGGVGPWGKQGCLFHSYLHLDLDD